MKTQPLPDPLYITTTSQFINLLHTPFTTITSPPERVRTVHSGPSKTGNSDRYVTEAVDRDTHWQRW